MADRGLNKNYTKVQKKQFVEEMLDKMFPFPAIIISTIFDILLGSAAVGLQIVQIVFGSSVYFIGCGFVN